MEHPGASRSSLDPARLGRRPEQASDTPVKGWRSRSWRTAAANLRSGSVRCLAIQVCVGWPLITPMITQTVRLPPSGTIWIDEAPNASRLDLAGAVQSNAEHPARNQKVLAGMRKPGIRGPPSASLCDHELHRQPDRVVELPLGLFGGYEG
jgi:hypothetical protein